MQTTRSSDSSTKYQTDSVPAAAAWLHQHGANVLPLDGKEVIPKWTRWQTERQSQEQANGLPWGRATGVGVLSGIGGWRCLDLDDCDELGTVLKILRGMGLPDNYRWVVKSGSRNGFHIWVRCSDDDGFGGCDDWEPKEGYDFDHIEVRWKNHQTAMPPSTHPDTGQDYIFPKMPPTAPPLEVSAEDVREGLQAVATPKRSGSSETGNEQRSSPSDYGDTDAEDIKAALAALPDSYGGDYDKWLRTIAAVKDGAPDDDTAERLLKDWRPEEKPGEYSRKLDSFEGGPPDGRDPVTVASLFDEAQKHGWTVPNPDTPFWHYDRDAEEVKIERPGLIEFLREHGFGKLYADPSRDTSTYVRVEDNIVRHTSQERIKDFILGYVRDLDTDHGQAVVAALLRGVNIYLSDALFGSLPPLDLDFHRDTDEAAFFYYRNGFVEVTADGYELHPYDELEGVIWADQVIGREFVGLSDSDDKGGWEWNQHLWNVADGDQQRHRSLCTALGYLQHGYKDPSVTKAIVFMDEKVADVAEGRTGKSLTAKALQHTCSHLRIDGRNFSFDSRFAFQEVSLDTQVIDFNDARERFPFERLFSLITDDFPVERKGQDRVTISFQDSPKFLLSTNYVIEGNGASFDDRTHQVEFSDYYGTEHTPEDEFGHRLFTDWDQEEWARFDNAMLTCVQLYLRTGLTTYEQVNVDYRQLKQSTCPDFAEWALDFIEVGCEYEKEALWRTFREDYAPDYDDLPKSKFGYWLSHFARIYDLEKSESKRRVNGSRTRYVTFG